MSNAYTVPLSEEQQRELMQEVKESRRNLERLRRKVQNLEKASKFLVTMNENAERVRDLNEQEILKNKQMAEEASQAKSTFLAQMSHEMRTPMNAIKVLSELLLRTDLDKLQKDYAKNIVNASSSLLNIINDILDFSKLDAQMFEIVDAPYDVSSLINDVANIVNLRAMDKNICFVTDIDKTLPAMLVGDDLRIKQILLNILQNAVKFTSSGHVRLVIEVEKGAADDEVVLVCAAEDTGVGINEENLVKLFEPFSQVDLMKNRQAEGTGLGLSISKSLLELMGGNIWVESEYGKGSTFRFRIPQRISDPTPFAHIDDPAPMRMLIAGTQSIKVQACAVMASNLGIACEIASNPQELLRHLKAHTYTHLLYYYDGFQSAVVDHAELLGDCKLITVKDIRYAGRQQTRPSVKVLFEPVLINEVSRVIGHADGIASQGLNSDAAEIGRFSVRGVNALIVDDNEVNLMVMNQLLNQYHIDSTLAVNGIEALDLTKDRKFDIIFMDHMMPIMNGVEATKKIRSDDNLNKDTPIVIVTANAIVGMREEFLREGLDDYISKPIDIKELNTIILKWTDPAKVVTLGGDNVPSDSETEDDLFMMGMSGLGLNAQEICDSMGYTPQTYLAVIDTFITSVPDTLDQLHAFKKSGDYNAFRIHVHGVKSALANIGAKKMSKAAARLESAAAEHNVEYIDATFPSFSDELRELLVGIKSVKPAALAPAPASEHPDQSLDEGSIRSLLDQVVEALDGLDSLSALDVLAELSANLSNDQQAEMYPTLDRIKTCIENFDYETATEQIGTLINAYAG